MTAIAGVDPDDVDDARIAEGEMETHAPSFRAYANEIAGSNAKVRRDHAPAAVHVPFPAKSGTNTRVPQPDVAKTATCGLGWT
jgi:hypothetical protein